MKTLIVIFLILAILLPNQAFSQKSKEEIHRDLLKKYDKLSSIELNFAMKGNSDFQGTVKAKKGNKYFLRMPIMTVICNGKQVWNYNEKDKKVIVSTFDKNAVGSFSIDKFFFSFLNDFTPDKLVREQTSGKTSIYVISFLPKDKSKTNQLRSFKVWLSKNQNDITTIEFDNNGNVQRFDVSRIKVNAKFNDKIFDFVAPKGVEVIDLK